MGLTDSNDVGVDIGQQRTLPRQPTWIANPHGPTGLIGRNGTRFVGLPNSACDTEEHQKKYPKLCKGPVQKGMLAHRRSVLILAAANFSFVPAFLGQNGLQATHLVIKHALHLGSLNFHLGHHLCLQGLDLGRVLAMVVTDQVLQRLLPIGKLVELELQLLDLGVLFVSFHSFTRQF